MRRFRRFIAVLVLLGVPAAACAANFRAEATTTRIENIARASAPSDWRDAWRHEARGSFSVFRELRHGLLATAEVTAGLEHVPDYRNADAAVPNVNGSLRQKFGLGAFAPALSVDAALRYRDSRLDLDDGWIASGALRFSKRLTRSWRTAVQGDWEQHYARNAIFDTKQHRFFVTVAWDITPWLQLSHGNGRLWGSFVANASAAVWPRALSGELGRHISDYYNTISWAPTGLYGPAWISYLVDGRVSFYWLELSPALGRYTSVPLRFEQRVSVNKVGIQYRQDVWSLSVLHRF